MDQYLKADEQTLSDLSIFGKGGKDSVYDIFNKTITQGGRATLEHLFRHPLTDDRLINKKAEMYRFFYEHGGDFPVDPEVMGTLAYYMENNDVRSQVHTGGKSLGQRVKDMMGAEADYVFVHDGVQAALRLFYKLDQYIRGMEAIVPGSAYETGFNRLMELVHAHEFRGLKPYFNSRPETKLNAMTLAELDKLIRFDHREMLLELLDMLYDLDVLTSVGKVARERGFHFARALPKDSGTLLYKKVYHPHVENAVANDLFLNSDHNLLFLTGANMAGKSTLMKSIGVALYLGHMGFPVAAEQFEFAVRDGIYTSINLADNLTAGTSHYYTEVLRVKEVAKELSMGRRLFVIFDELFRGTNVKDAYDATIALTRAFCNKRGSQFIISTHIMEAGEVLREASLPISYQFLPTEMKGSTPIYTRVLREGITADRQGMIIIQNEGILEMLDAGVKQKES